MSWAMRLAVPPHARAAGIENARKYDEHIVRSGQRTAYLEGTSNQRRWAEARYGITLTTGTRSQLFWNARCETIEKTESWNRLVGQRVAIPIDRYGESKPRPQWYGGDRAWMPGLINRSFNGGIVTLTEDDKEGGRRPIIISDAGAIAWLDAKNWDALKLVRQLDRCSYSSVDDFEFAQLSNEAKTAPRIAV